MSLIADKLKEFELRASKFEGALVHFLGGV